MKCRYCGKPLLPADALPGLLHFACAARLSLAMGTRAKKTDPARLREASAILSEVLVESSVPAPLRKLAAAWLEERRSSMEADAAKAALRNVKTTGKGGDA